ncbi:hypothetical protein RHSIM_Rhsim13G0072800 [Rhododendron simsii]|uniref:Uncharacterized protein n=1 Tax=Rhododendron simsii TaxID=118357 RepID=A0A834G4B5_RHOSS|nr:hypothetical protein RHSIM_Rhsim13G0072800 [Rhododendron simsii]
MNSIDGENTMENEEDNYTKDEDNYTKDGTVDYRGNPANKKKTGTWKACPYILGIECCERLAYYGMSSNLVLYFKYRLNQRNATASKYQSQWAGTCYITPLIGAFLDDSYLGRYWTIACFSTIYIFGMTLLTLSASVSGLRPACVMKEDCHPTHTQSAVTFFALYLVALGTGGIKPCISSYGVYQFDDACRGLDLDQSVQVDVIVTVPGEFAASSPPSSAAVAAAARAVGEKNRLNFCLMGIEKIAERFLQELQAAQMEIYLVMGEAAYTAHLALPSSCPKSQTSQCSHSGAPSYEKDRDILCCCYLVTGETAFTVHVSLLCSYPKTQTSQWSHSSSGTPPLTPINPPSSMPTPAKPSPSPNSNPPSPNSPTPSSTNWVSRKTTSSVSTPPIQSSSLSVSSRSSQ